MGCVSTSPHLVFRLRTQEKNAAKPDIDAAVNELKELKIALESAVKVRLQPGQAAGRQDQR